MLLLNVRLGPEDERMAAALRIAGVPISALVRTAIRTEYERRIGAQRRMRRPSEIVRGILEDLPDTEVPAEPRVRTTDRRAVTRHIRAKLARTRA